MEHIFKTNLILPRENYNIPLPHPDPLHLIALCSTFNYKQMPKHGHYWDVTGWGLSQTLRDAEKPKKQTVGEKTMERDPPRQ